MSHIGMTVFKREGRKFFECQWVDPTTGKKRTKSTRETSESKARQFAGRLQAELEQQGEFRKNVTWQDFKSQYLLEVVAPQRKKSRQNVASAFNAIETHVSPKKLTALTAGVISQFASKLRATGISEASVKRHLSALRTMLRWAYKMKMLREVPHIAMPRKVGGMKGRAPSQEEFERILGKVRAVVKKEREASWRFLIRGLWWSGLRISEAVDLHWTDDRLISVDLTGKRPRFRIQIEADKGTTFRLLPMAPEFARMILAVPEAERHGYVFNPLPVDGGPRLNADWVSKVISMIGEKAGVKVATNSRLDPATGETGDVVKYASAHDFRRAFGLRWAGRVMPNVLMELMRHASIETTMRYYVGKNADITGEIIWEAVANVSANTPENDLHADSPDETQPVDRTQLTEVSPP